MRGFTLIELLISISIMMLIVGGGIAAFINFNDKQQLLGAAKEVQTYSRSAQVKAQVGDRPTDCDKLQAVAVRASNGSNTLSLIALCGDALPPDEVVTETKQLGSQISFDQAIDVQFLTLRGGVTGAGTISLSSPYYIYTFSVMPGGEIDEGDFLETN